MPNNDVVSFEQGRIAFYFSKRESSVVEDSSYRASADVPHFHIRVADDVIGDLLGSRYFVAQEITVHFTSQSS